MLKTMLLAIVTLVDPRKWLDTNVKPVWEN